MTPFEHGVASGDPLGDRVVIWTRISGADGPVDVDWEVARDPAFGEPVASGSTVTDEDVDFTVHVDVDGLAQGTTYHYRFRVGDDVSPVGRTRTLPMDDAGALRFAMVSCAKFNAGFFNAYAHLAARDDLDFVLHLGDYIYEASNTPPASQTPGADIGRPFDPLHECVTLEDYRTRYRQYHRDPDLQAFHAAHPMIATLDDHEFADGAWREGATEHKDEYGPWAGRRADAFRARWEWIPARPPNPADRERVFRSVPLAGDLADLFLIDTRTRRDEPLDELQDPNPPTRTALGEEQHDWFLQGLAASDATWRLLANPSVMAQTWRPDLPDSVLPALGKVKLVHESLGGPDLDQWDGYPGERKALLDYFGRMPDVVVLSGDVHVCLAAELSTDPFADDGPDPVAVEFVTPSMTSQNLDDKMGWARRTESRVIEEELLGLLPHWRLCDLDSHGYVQIDVVPERVTATWYLLDTVLERGSAIAPGPVLAVDHGTHRLFEP